VKRVLTRRAWRLDDFLGNPITVGLIALVLGIIVACLYGNTR